MNTSPNNATNGDARKATLGISGGAVLLTKSGLCRCGTAPM
jgi:hypothetical protein